MRGQTHAAFGQGQPRRQPHRARQPRVGRQRLRPAALIQPGKDDKAGGLAHALGETAPLLMIGMKAFVVEYPTTPFDPSTALPTQIYMWATEPERAFTERTSAAIIVLLAFLLAQLLDITVFNALRNNGGWWKAPLLSSFFGSALDTALFFSIAFASQLSFINPA